MHVADSSGVLREVVDAWVSDGVSWRDVTDGYTADATGTLKHWAAFGGQVVVTVTAIDHLSFRIGWESVSSDQVALKVNGTTVFTSLDDTGNYVVSGQTPASTVTVTGVATFSGSDYTSTAVIHTLSNIPAPSSVGVGIFTATSMVVSWAAVSGATSYEVYNADSNVLLQTTSSLTWTRTGLTAGVTYRMYVKARFSGSVVSSPSPTVTGTTTATFPAGTYTFKPAANNTWQTTPAQWRGTSGGETYHGNGYPWSSRGVNTAYFFDYKDANGVSLPTFFSGGAPVNVIKVEVYVSRLNTAHGINSAQLCRFYRHQHTAQPTTPATYSDAYNNGTLTRGEAKWVDLPVSWGPELISGLVKGIAWGGTPQASDGARYMIGPTLGVLSTMMQVRITVA